MHSTSGAGLMATKIVASVLLLDKRSAAHRGAWAAPLAMNVRLSRAVVSPAVLQFVEHVLYLGRVVACVCARWAFVGPGGKSQSRKTCVRRAGRWSRRSGGRLSCSKIGFVRGTSCAY